MAGEGEIPESSLFGDLGDLIPLLNSLFGTEQNQSVTENSPEGQAAAQQLMPILMQMLTSQDFSQEAAGRDAQGQVDMIIKQMLEGGIPNILNAENVSGGYAGTTAALLKNDLASRAAGEGANRIASVRNQYAGQRNAQSTLLIQLINAMTNANRVRNTSNNNQGLVQNSNAQRAAGLAALAAMAGNKKPKPPKKPPEMGGGGGGTRSPDAENRERDLNADIAASESYISEQADAAVARNDALLEETGIENAINQSQAIDINILGENAVNPNAFDLDEFSFSDNSGFASSDYFDFDASGDQFDFVDLGSDIFGGDEYFGGEGDTWDFIGDDSDMFGGDEYMGGDEDFWNEDSSWFADEDWSWFDEDFFGGGEDFNYVDDWGGDY